MTPKQQQQFKSKIYDVCNEFGLSDFNITTSKFINKTELVFNHSTCNKDSKTIVGLISKMTYKALETLYLNEDK